MIEPKEIATQIAIELISSVAQEDLTGEEKEQKVCTFLAKLDNGVVGLGLIPDALEAKLLNIGIDKVQEHLDKIDLKYFVKTQYNRIKSLLKRLFKN